MVFCSRVESNALQQYICARLGRCVIQSFLIFIPLRSGDKTRHRKGTTARTPDIGRTKMQLILH